MSGKIIPIPNTFYSEELLRNPKALRVILDAADIPINYCSAERKFLFANKTYAEWYGLTPEDIIGKMLSDVLGEEGEKTIRPYYERALKGEHFRYETEVNLSIGRRYLQCSYTPVYDNEGIVTGWVGIIYDMTERYLLEKALHENEAALLQAKEKAETANIAKSEFLANMSHEIRTPMNAVLGLAHILSKSTPLTVKQKEFISTLQLSAQSLLSLINDLLDFSKLESNSIDLENIPYRFSSIIEETIAMFSMQAQEQGIALEYAKSELDGVRFLGDPLRVRQILTNLIGNAIKFTHKGGVTVQLSITPNADPGTVFVHLGVKDTGIGIPASKIGSVFDKFIQADMTITRQYGGSGLGLAISKNLAELMGGSITLKSTVGEGSEFTLHLPLQYADEELPFAPFEPRKNSSTSAAEQKITVLLAEDHPPNVLVATTILESMGYQCDVVHTGKAVLAAIEKSRARYDIILMDVQMPEFDGYVTTRLLREDEKKKGYKRLPIIGVTAHVMEGDITKCYEAGMDDYIGKPFNADDLKRKITTLISASRARD